MPETELVQQGKDSSKGTIGQLSNPTSPHLHLINNKQTHKLIVAALTASTNTPTE